MCKEVLVYSGEGAGVRSVQSAVQALQSTLRLGPPDKPALKVPGCAAMHELRAPLPHVQALTNPILADTQPYMGMCTSCVSCLMS